jgi:hypothetical protein
MYAHAAVESATTTAGPAPIMLDLVRGHLRRPGPAASPRGSEPDLSALHFLYGESPRLGLEMGYRRCREPLAVASHVSHGRGFSNGTADEQLPQSAPGSMCKVLRHRAYETCDDPRRVDLDAVCGSCLPRPTGRWRTDRYGLAAQPAMSAATRWGCSGRSRMLSVTMAAARCSSSGSGRPNVPSSGCQPSTSASSKTSVIWLMRSRPACPAAVAGSGQCEGTVENPDRWYLVRGDLAAYETNKTDRLGIAATAHARVARRLERVAVDL